MSVLAVLAKGLALGFAIAAPVGPIGLLCIRRTLAGGPALGLATGLGAATADAAYGAVAGFGLAAVSHAIQAWAGPIALLGGAVLVGLGLKTAFAAPAAAAAGAAGGSGRLLGAWASSAALTLANPATILSFAAAFAAFGLVDGGAGPGEAAFLVLGVFVGSAAWWAVLTGAVGAVRARVSPGAMRWINRASGAVLVAFGAAALARGLA